MNYSEAVDYIHNTLKFGIKLGLHNMNTLLGLMDNPHKKLKYVHVAGTNGKGSTVAFISSILIESGYKTGIYTSPFLERFTERIKINDREIGESDLARITEYVKSKVELMVSMGENHPTEFEIVTAIAFQYFYESACDIVVLEVGLGGRYDSTNVIEKPLAAVITTISYDHMDRLGDTLPKIAFEKAGIIKENSNVVLYPQDYEVEEVFCKICREKNAVLHKIDFSSLDIQEYGIEGQTFSYGGYQNLKISLLGSHQVRNSIVAIKTAELLVGNGFSISENSIRTGLLKAKWPGRLEVLCKSPLVLIDGAHNAEGAKVLHDTLKAYFPEKKKIFIMGVLKDKDYQAMLEVVMPLADEAITVTPESDRALPAEDLAIIAKTYCKNIHVSDTIEDALRMGMKMAQNSDVVCAFGSLYYIGEVRSFFNEKHN